MLFHDFHSTLFLFHKSLNATPFCKVREEMQSELAVYQHKMKAIEAGRLPSASGDTGNEEDKYPDLADLEPELREAYIKMRKLDRILEKRVKREREVKRDRILLERRYF